MKDAKKYLEQRLLNCSRYSLTNQDKLLVKTTKENYIYKKLTSGKYRKWSIDDADKKRIKRIIHNRVSNNKPLLFTYPFGGYKLWRLPTAPGVDWAEFFSIAYFLEYLAPIAAGYKPGVELYFSSDEVIIERMDNVPKSDTDKYSKSFKKLIPFFFPVHFYVQLRHY